VTGPVGTRYAFQVIHPGPPALRIRYRAGVSIDPYGFPDWLPYSRVLVQLPPSSPDLGVAETRVLRVLTANHAVAATGDPLWTGGEPYATPAGWTWAHLPRDRYLGLVPVELHGAFRHVGGVSTGNADRRRAGLPTGDGPPPPLRYGQRLDEPVLVAIEQRLGTRLNAAYRDFLARTNGAAPVRPAVHPGHGFIVDQPFFGLARPDRLQDLVQANASFTDRLTGDFLAIGYVQGGLLAIRIRGGDEGSIWYWDDDDHRDRDGYTADDVSARLLHRCADDFDGFWLGVREVPRELRSLALANAPGATLAFPPGLGAGLPPAAKRRLRPGGTEPA
jgi:hypothetical protein